MLIESFSGTRGLFSEELLDLAGRYAKAYSQTLPKDGKVVIGRDSRPSGSLLSMKMVRVLTAQGITVEDVGILPTPAIEFAVRYLKCDGGIIITASHNPPDFNGWKLLQKNGGILRPDQIEKIIKDAKTAAYTENPARLMDKHDGISKAYCDFIHEIVGPLRNTRRFILDPNGGSAITILQRLVHEYHLTGKVINTESGTYAHLIEPTREAMEHLANQAREEEASYAFAYDCDADRVEMILPDGTHVDGNIILAMILDLVLPGNKGPVVTNDATSLLIRDICKSHQVEHVEVEVGETNVVEKMYALRSPVGGEGSNGGVIVPPNRCRDGILTTFQLLKYLEDKDIKKLIASYPTYVQEWKKLTFDNEHLEKINQNIASLLKEKGYTVIKKGDAYGSIKVFTQDGFIFFRASRTEPGAYRIIVEGKDAEQAKQLMQDATTIWESAK